MSISLAEIKTIWLDVEGVLLSNGLDHHLLNRTASHFNLQGDALIERHRMIFDDFERGKISFDDYLQHIIFFSPRNFDRTEVKNFILEQSQPYQEMIDLFRTLKCKYPFKIALLCNEGREIAHYRINRFKLFTFVDYYIVSSFVKMRKPELRIYQLALQLCQTAPEQILYIDDSAHEIAIARSLNVQGICHFDFATTKSALQQ